MKHVRVLLSAAAFLVPACSGGDAATDAGPVDAGMVMDSGPADEGVQIPGFVVFVRAGQLSGDSIPDSDARCQSWAEAAGLDGQFVSWISTSQQNAIDKLPEGQAWYGLDGNMVFADRSAIAQGPAQSISLDENGSPVEGMVYTGTDNAGVHTSGEDCRGWRSYYDYDDGTVGDTRSAANWTRAEVIDCGRPRHVYCFQTQ